LFAINALTFSVSPLNGEDFGLSRLGGYGRLVETLLWVGRRSVRQFTGWNARFGEQLAIFWMAMPDPWFTVVSMVAFAGFCWCVTAIAQRSIRFDQAFLTGWLAASSLCWLAWPRMEMFFWRTAAAEYLQPLVLNLLVALVFVAEDFRLAVTRGPYRVVAAAVPAFLAGMSFENIPPALLIYFGWRVLRVRRQSNEKIWSLILLALAYALGWIALMIAPSTRLRIGYYKAQFHVPEMSFAYLAGRAHDVVGVFRLSSFALLVVFSCCVLIGFLRLRAWRRQFLGSLGFLLPGLLSCASLVFAPYTEPRSFALLWVSMLVCVVWAFCRWETATVSDWRKIPVLALAVLALGMAAGVYGEYARFGEQANRRVDTIVANIGLPACASGLEVPRLRTHASPRILNNRDDWFAGSLPQVDLYFGCHVIVVADGVSARPLGGDRLLATGVVEARPALLGSLGATGRMTKELEPPACNLEQIGNEQRAWTRHEFHVASEKEVLVSGWAVDGDREAAAAGVDVVIDGVPHSAQYGIERPDVEEHFTCALCRKSGFAFAIPAHTLSTGVHHLMIRVVARSQGTYRDTVPVTVAAQ
jgi:hypothetical protein